MTASLKPRDRYHKGAVILFNRLLVLGPILGLAPPAAGPTRLRVSLHKIAWSDFERRQAGPQGRGAGRAE